MLAKAGNMPPSLGVKSEEANGTEVDDYSPRSCESDRCSASSLSTSPESTPMRARPSGQSPSVTCAVEVTLLSAQDSHAPLVAAAWQRRAAGPGQLALSSRAVSSKGDAKRSSRAGSLLHSKLCAAKANGQIAVTSRKEDKAPGGLLAARPPSRLAAAVAVAKAESSGDLMGFLSMLAAGQSVGRDTVATRARDDSSLPLGGTLSRESTQNGCDGACSEASTSSFTVGYGVDVLSRTVMAEGASGSGGVVCSSSFDLDAEPAVWLSTNGDGGAADVEDWVAKKGSLRWIRQRAGGAEVDGGGPIRRRARRGIRARGEMGYELLRSPWSWGDTAESSADKDFAAEPDQDAGMLRNLSNGGLSHDSDSAFGGEQEFAEHDGDHLDCSSSVEKGKGSKGKWFSLSAGQSTEDLLNAFTKDLEAADKPQPQTKAAISLRCWLFMSFFQLHSLLFSPQWWLMLSMTCKGLQISISDRGFCCRASAQKAKQLLTPAELDAQMASLAGPAAVREPDLVLVRLMLLFFNHLQTVYTSRVSIFRMFRTCLERSEKSMMALHFEICSDYSKNAFWDCSS